MRLASTTVVAALAALAGCGGSGGGRGGDVLVEIGGEPPDAGAGDLETIVGADLARAGEVLSGALGGEERVAAWAAVYAARLGVRCDEAALLSAASKGPQTGDPLLAALCWRLLAGSEGGDLPAAESGTEDPAAAALAAVAFARRGGIPSRLESALGLEERATGGGGRAPAGRVDELRLAAVPFDDGPLALAAAFVEARREGWIEGAGARPGEAAARRIRGELLEALDADGPEVIELVEACPAPTDPRYSDLPELILSPLRRQPLAVLRGAALEAEGKLRVGALRALAGAVAEPAAGDLGAAAAAMRDEDPLVRVEAARTYLMLAARAVEGP
ncbi:MAG: hypothetical protein R6V85_04410 [Polyangia bacterium]